MSAVNGFSAMPRSSPPSPVPTMREDDRPPIFPWETGFAVLIVLGNGDRLLHRPEIVRLQGSVEVGRGRPSLTGTRWTIDDPHVCQAHARLQTRGQEIEIADLGSRQGTVVGGRRLRAESVRVPSGSLLMIGGHFAVLRIVTEDQLAAIADDQAQAMGPVPTSCPGLAATVRTLRRLARSNEPLLLSGETGVGKEVYARAVHVASGRPGPFVAVNCAAIPFELFESLLFGYKRGSHSRAVTDEPGLILQAEGGTLFLDELGEMPELMQCKLLRFLQEKTVHGLGWTTAQPVDVRVIAATQSPRRTLRADMIGRFGNDHFQLPPLRRRREDLGSLALHLLAAARPQAPLALAPEALMTMFRHDWPYNIRELDSVIRRAACLAADRGDHQIRVSDLPASLLQSAVSPSSDAPSTPISDALDAPDLAAPVARRQPRPRPSSDQLCALLEQHAGNVPSVARALGRYREQIWRWCREYRVDPGRFRKATC